MAEKKDRNEERNPVGRPPYYSSPEELQSKIDDYFESGMNTRRIFVGFKTMEVPAPTITGLALFLGFESRQSFYDYGKRPEFSYAIKKAASKIEQYYEECLQFGQQAGSIFALKNMGWSDKTEHEHSGKEGKELKFVLFGQTIDIA